MCINVHACILRCLQLSLEEKIGVIAREIYGADGISLSDEAKKKIEDYTRQVRYEMSYPTTQLSTGASRVYP